MVYNSIGDDFTSPVCNLQSAARRVLVGTACGLLNRLCFERKRWWLVIWGIVYMPQFWLVNTIVKSNWVNISSSFVVLYIYIFSWYPWPWYHDIPFWKTMKLQAFDPGSPPWNHQPRPQLGQVQPQVRPPRRWMQNKDITWHNLT